SVGSVIHGCRFRTVAVMLCLWLTVIHRSPASVSLLTSVVHATVDSWDSGCSCSLISE
ncbi:hypothetical protein A2U01_0077233, partial [Trifolium medium]|nr:hypothetical protein [Trifolium medium]